MPRNSTPVPTGKNIRLLQLSPLVLKALGDGDIAAARLGAAIAFSDYLVGPESRSVWRRRALQIVEDPSSATWITRAVIDADSGAVVGRAGFHGPPDDKDMVEVGYAIDPAFRRQGYARAALVALLKSAKDEPSVRTVRATTSPGNIASRALIADYGFVQVGEQWDDEDGLEIIFEVEAKRSI